jgi:hypothetical protein
MQQTRRQQRKATDVAFEINLLGTEAERLALQQAVVIRDVLQWHHRNSDHVPPRAEAKSNTGGMTC